MESSKSNSERHTPEEQLAVGLTICEEISQGDFLRKACEKHGITPGTFWRWQNASTALRDAYARARESRIDVRMEAIHEIAEAVDASGEWGSAEVAKARLQIDTMKWEAAKVQPSRWGDKSPEINVTAIAQAQAQAGVSMSEAQESIRRLRDDPETLAAIRTLRARMDLAESGADVAGPAELPPSEAMLKTLNGHANGTVNGNGHHTNGNGVNGNGNGHAH